VIKTESLSKDEFDELKQLAYRYYVREEELSIDDDRVLFYLSTKASPREFREAIRVAFMEVLCQSIDT